MSFNEWKVAYPTILFVERALRGHNKVADFSRKQDILFTISHVDGKEIKMLLVNEYCLGLAAVHKALGDFPEAEYIVTSANWNGYTREAKKYGLDNEIGIFNISEFFGALNWSKPKTYYQTDEDGNKVYAYKVA